jgi:hypothetical protein
MRIMSNGWMADTIIRRGAVAGGALKDRVRPSRPVPLDRVAAQ